jgi:hypothetical protein
VRDALGEEAHRAFMDRSGLIEDLLAPAYLGGDTAEGAGSRALRISAQGKQSLTGISGAESGALSWG